MTTTQTANVSGGLCSCSRRMATPKTPYRGQWPCRTALSSAALSWIWGCWLSSPCSTVCLPGHLSNRPSSQCWGSWTGRRIASPQRWRSRYSNADPDTSNATCMLYKTSCFLTLHGYSLSCCVRCWCVTGSQWLAPPVCGQCVMHPGVSGYLWSASLCTSSAGPSSAASSWSLITQNCWASSR